MALQDNVLAVTDHVLLPLKEVSNALRVVKKEVSEDINPLIVTQGLSQGNFFVLASFYCCFMSMESLFLFESLFFPSNWVLICSAYGMYNLFWLSISFSSCGCKSENLHGCFFFFFLKTYLNGCFCPIWIIFLRYFPPYYI